MNLAPIVTRLGRGTTANARRAARAFWDDVPNKERAARLVALLVGCWVAGGIVLAARSTMWALLAVWCIAAWRTGHRVERAEAAEAAFVQWIYGRIGNRNGVLVAELLDGLHQSGMHKEWDAAALRGVIERLGIPVRDSLRVGGFVSTGVHVDDLTAAWDVHITPPPTAEPNPSPTPVTSDNYPTTPTVVESASGAQVTITPGHQVAPQQASSA
ncbi:hypothetical protein [Streptomyces sp. NBC_01320]|uniref:hypothetical protein n=1 Tax=Streptomyces sp. NBC_01320 TaxID=2903824 RepID=UPI002E13B4FE|nr:hypothetical protein OG395_35405 [Streptomyces sp. NBC_01320]